MVINLSTMYATKDTVELFVNKRIANSTILHHIGVICAYLYCLSVLTTSEFNTEGIFKNFIVYAGFACLDLPFKIFLAVRFFVSRTGRPIHHLKRFCFLPHLFCLGCNFSWQTFYLLKRLHCFYSSGTGLQLPLVLSVVTFFTLLSGWIQEEIVMMRHFW